MAVSYTHLDVYKRQELIKFKNYRKNFIKMEMCIRDRYRGEQQGNRN